MNRMHRIFTGLTLLLLLSLPVCAQSVSPFMGLGSAQFLDQNGKPLSSGVLYSFQAGTTNQQATYTDSTGTIANPNPITFTSGARASIWLSVGKVYKFVLCAQNDGAACAPADTLFSVDQVPASSSGSGSGSSPFTGTFISGSANPATSGILRMASGDSLCFRNAAGSANLCLSKDSSDVVTWASGAFKIPEIACGSTGAGFDYLCADSSAHRWKMANNGGSQFLVPGIASAGTSNNLATLASNGIDIQDSGHSVNWESTLGWGAVNDALNLTCTAAGAFQCPNTIFAFSHVIGRVTFNLINTASGCAVNAVIGVWDFTSSSALYSVTIAAQPAGFQDSGPLNTTIPAGHQVGVGVITANSGCTTSPTVSGLTMVYQ